MQTTEKSRDNNAFGTTQEVSQEAVPPKPFRRLSDNLLEIRSGGGVLSLFGLPFLGAGVFLLLAGTGIVRFDNAAGVPMWAYPLMFLMGLAFGGAGTALVFGRTWILIDKATGGITKAKGLLTPMRREVLPLRAYGAVCLSFAAGDSDSPDRFPVLLKGDQNKELVLSSPSDFATGFQQATYLAAYLSWPFEDATSDRVHRLAPSELKVPLSERLRAKDSFHERAEQPFTLHSTIERGDGELKITVPVHTFRLWRLLPALIPVVIALYILPQVGAFLDESQTPPEVQTWIYGLALLFLVGFPLLSIASAALKARLSFSRLTVTRRDLTIAKRSLWRTRSRSIVLVDITDIDFQSAGSLKKAARQAAHEALRQRRPGSTTSLDQYPHVNRLLSWASQFVTSRGIIIKSRRGLYSFGAGLPDDEVAYLCRLVRERIGS